MISLFGTANARRCLIALTSFWAAASNPLEGNTQQLIPVIKQEGPAASNTSVLNTYLTTQDTDGCTYVSLEQLGAVVGGHLRWQRASKLVDLSVRNHEVKFFFNSKKIMIDGKAQWLPHASLKDDGGFWVPASFFASQQFFQLSQSRLDWPPAPPKPVPPLPLKPTPLEPPVASDEKTPVPVEPVAKSAASAKTEGPPHAIRRIVIDPGHGGKDPGTVGSHGIEEKALNLLMSQALADRLREDDYEVLLTRTDDTFIPLAGRARLANLEKADLFISIHCNASLSTSLNGLEVYFLSETASDPHADAVARSENASLALEGKNPHALSHVQSLLHSLEKNENINEASTLGALVGRQVGRSLGVHTVNVKQAGFYVLRGAEMPAILIESGFLTNKSEEKKLLDDKYRKHLVAGVADAIEAYDKRREKERGHG